ncbi:MAG: RsmE family RNA methyltransferase, partial [Deltaproteobacteria bacterium]|nr:RsmE family RNA methyltransferase [Deltaproteobacteria bacterium]
ELEKLDRLLGHWPAERALYFCDETLAGDGTSSWEKYAGGPGAEPPTSAVLIGPEGGFSEAERARLAALPFARPVALGPRILRADTAAVAALALWQSRIGDWR